LGRSIVQFLLEQALPIIHPDCNFFGGVFLAYGFLFPIAVSFFIHYALFMSYLLPDLRIVPLRSVVIQEYFDSGISRDLLRKIEEDGVLMNPPIVAAFGSRYLHLDGANRLTTLAELGYPHAIVQVVDYFDPRSVELKSWCHVSAVDERRFMRLIRGLPGVSVDLLKVGRDRHVSLEKRTVCLVVFADGKACRVWGNEELVSQVSLMNKVVDFYKHLVIRDQEDVFFDEETLAEFFRRHQGKNVVLFFPTFRPQDVLNVVRAGEKFPPGITRHIIRFRALRVNFPLAVLKSPRSLAWKRDYLKRFMEKIEWRVYEEPVVMGER